MEERRWKAESQFEAQLHVVQSNINCNIFGNEETQLTKLLKPI